jgi:hypothetical protein
VLGEQHELSSPTLCSFVLRNLLSNTLSLFFH